jgi:serine/threonine-protein kinase
VGSAARVHKTCPRCRRAFDPDAAFCPDDGAALEEGPLEPCDPDPYIGALVHGDIELRALAGAGAMGRVYRAHQRGIDRDVAVKILRRELSGTPPLAQRFHREAKIASRLQHPHVVEVYLAGELPDGALYIVMEYLDGLSLADALKAAGGALPAPRALSIVLQICDAVGEAHERGVVHRDLKPENVMLVRRGVTSDWVKVLDFGIAKVRLGEQSMETAAGVIFGTARYISPEGAQGAAVGPPSDVYSIAVLLYHLLAGRTPFDAEQPVGFLVKHIHETAPPLRSWPAASGVPAELERVVMDNLAKEPRERAPNARALGERLAEAAAAARLSLAPLGRGSHPSSVEIAPPRKVHPVEPTLDDDDARAPAPSPVEPVRGAPRTVIDTPRRTADALAATTAGAPATTDTGLTAPRARADERRRRPNVLVALAFLLGVALTALAMQQLGERHDAERHAVVRRVRLALASSHYVDPPGENVRELVAAGLARWPNDADLLRLKSDAAHELETRALAARSVGDIVEAHDLARSAHELDPTDATAKLLLDQYEDELAAATSDAGPDLGAPRVMLDVPVARRGERSEVVARVLVSRAQHAVSGARFIVRGPGLDAVTLVVSSTGSGSFRGSFVPPRDGAYAVQFEANVDGAIVRANRTLTVTPGR